VLAQWCAVLKFLLVGAGLVYIILGAVLVMVGGQERPGARRLTGASVQPCSPTPPDVGR